MIKYFFNSKLNDIFDYGRDITYLKDQENQIKTTIENIQKPAFTESDLLPFTEISRSVKLHFKF